MSFEELKEVFVDTLNCDADKVTMEASLTEDLQADSLDAVEPVSYTHLRYCSAGGLYGILYDPQIQGRNGLERDRLHKICQD